MGIEAADFDKYDVVYVSNAEEHQYLDSYVPKKQIGTKALSSVLVSLADSGNGLKVSTYNINYCTAGMYKNALATAGVEDANVIVAGPFPLSGTAALVGTFEAYEKLTGKELDESVVDAAMDELVTTGDLEQSIDGDSNDVEAMIADLKGQIASGKIKTPEEMEQLARRGVQSLGMPAFVITLGEKGCVFCGAEGESGWEKAIPTVVRDASGAGDAFFAGAVTALAQGCCLREAVRAGTRAASFVLSSEENTLPATAACACLEEKEDSYERR